MDVLLENSFMMSETTTNLPGLEDLAGFSHLLTDWQACIK
jgi:hypothetical protein